MADRDRFHVKTNAPRKLGFWGESHDLWYDPPFESRQALITAKREPDGKVTLTIQGDEETAIACLYPAYRRGVRALSALRDVPHGG